MIGVIFLTKFVNFKAGDRATFRRERAAAVLLGGVAILEDERDVQWLESLQAQTS